MQIDVHHAILDGMKLDVLDEHASGVLGVLLHLQVHEDVLKGPLPEEFFERIPGHGQVQVVDAPPVEHGGHPPVLPKFTAGSTAGVAA